ncbi:Putative carbohydrate kinase, thermoresistant glucokinase [Septoria linicola]|uniref:Gluconokinase n=1 Tax=Septoria linicola TaxID=215465 RepID=A0A9Q9AGM7_9PEZI|nr:putative carbohydrate kinase, thermoresistant glucokinase [Septoria linicola]USW47244.1 Putative carbohydrate kinase, thermoresistant glucokinase [Septoria linicola]
MSQQAIVHCPNDPQHFPPTPPSEASTELSKMSTNNSTVSTAATSLSRWESQHKHIWFITGPAGCGKTSVAEYLHSKFALPYLEGDTFHTPENVKKMAEGQPLTDADRWDWLVTLREESVKALQNAPTDGVIVTCSALKRKYRDVMRVAAYHHPEIRVHFVFLKATEALLMDRVRARKNHYMKDYMVHSQFESLEAPTDDESDVLAVDASGTSTEVKELALKVVEKEMSGDSS